MAEWISYGNQGATRNLPLDASLVNALSFLPEMGLTMEVFSGGQPPAGQGPRVGSDRHDHGKSADVFFYENGRQLDWSDPNDVVKFQEIVQRGKEAGLTGFGAGPGYMRPGSMHVGFGTPSVWGAGGKSANAPSWLRQAYYGQPVSTPPNRAVAAINAAAPAPAVKPKGGIMGGIGHALMGGVNTLQAAANQALPGIQAKTAEVGPEAIMRALSTVQGRTAIGKYLMNKNISKAPEAVAGNVMGGTPVMAVSNQGRTPMTLMRSGTQSGGSRSQSFDQKYHPGQDMSVYRANRAAIGDRITQANINQALMRGSTLYRRRDPDEGTPQSLVG